MTANRQTSFQHYIVDYITGLNTFAQIDVWSDNSEGQNTQYTCHCQICLHNILFVMHDMSLLYHAYNLVRIGLPSSAPIVTSVTPFSSTSFTVNWTISYPNYSYTVIWTNINTGVVDSIGVPENTNSYTVTGLSVNDNYNVSVAIVGVCGMMTSDPITVYG